MLPLNDGHISTFKGVLHARACDLLTWNSDVGLEIEGKVLLIHAHLHGAVESVVGARVTLAARRWLGLGKMCAEKQSSWAELDHR